MKTFKELKEMEFSGKRFVIFTRFKFENGDTSGYDFNETFATKEEAIKFCKNIDFSNINFRKGLEDDTISYVVGIAEFENGEFQQGEDGDFENSHYITKDEAVW